MLAAGCSGRKPHGPTLAYWGKLPRVILGKVRAAGMAPETLPCATPCRVHASGWGHDSSPGGRPLAGEEERKGPAISLGGQDTPLRTGRRGHDSSFLGQRTSESAAGREDCKGLGVPAGCWGHDSSPGTRSFAESPQGRWQRGRRRKGEGTARIHSRDAGF